MSANLSLAAIAVLAFAVGFASQRGSVCGVLAARQIVEIGRFSRLVAFVTASFWAMAVALPLAWLLPGSFSLAPTHPGLLPAVVGGAGMGFAATFGPGGNDSLLLGALPAMAWHGAAAYAAMMAVQLTLLAVAKVWKDRAARARAGSRQTRVLRAVGEALAACRS